MTAFVKVAILNGTVEGEVTNTDSDAVIIYKDALRQNGFDPDTMTPLEIVQECAVLCNAYLWETGQAWAASQAANTAREDTIDSYPPPADT